MVAEVAAAWERSADMAAVVMAAVDWRVSADGRAGVSLVLFVFSFVIYSVGRYFCIVSVRLFVRFAFDGDDRLCSGHRRITWPNVSEFGRGRSRRQQSNSQTGAVRWWPARCWAVDGIASIASSNATAAATTAL